ncbi:hypothetical protein TRFO_15304 [Tritrichomonas foetus]|uniref:Initiator binding domain-containing protein n=1 Tax=Tritrichomonas foetus TaxID=1144522 RepID=A0A1J4KXE1_9EUKA|nr:hypothetical protein TRFO_15304 [Tritrichomonas foetus]|eukprot:OHT14374.1 hypothetical protein TRFO_15304 [Tritrichomonas foetus]
MQQEDFHSYWTDSPALIDPTSSFVNMEMPKLTFDDWTSNANDDFCDISYSPTLITRTNPSPLLISEMKDNESIKFQSNHTSNHLLQFPKFDNDLNPINDDSDNNEYEIPQVSKAHSDNFVLNTNISMNEIDQNPLQKQASQKVTQQVPPGVPLSSVAMTKLSPQQIAFLSNIFPNITKYNFYNNNLTNNRSNNINNNYVQPLGKKTTRSTIAVLENDDFKKYCSEYSFVVNPFKLGFIPSNSWLNKETTFGNLVSSFFQKRNNSTSRFSHKLFNALRLSTEFPNLTKYIGVEWITPTILKVDKVAFATLLKIKTVDGSLFHQQGNFPSHGFVELTEKEATQQLSAEQLLDVDYETVRLLRHPAGVFKKDCTGNDIDELKWINSRRK